MIATSRILPWAAIAIVEVAMASVGFGQQPASTSPQPQGATAITPAQQAKAELEHPRFTAAGVQFMSGMIGHHRQAIVMADWAPSHGASEAVNALAQRIAVSQVDEIAYMQSWLKARHQVVPVPDPAGDTMPGMDHAMLMPGMLTPPQMTQLDEARGAAFDRLFLTDMIAHHQGAIEMVHQLTASGPEEDDALVIYAINVEADQSAEIGRMERMLALRGPGSATPDSAH